MIPREQKLILSPQNKHFLTHFACMCDEKCLLGSVDFYWRLFSDFFLILFNKAKIVSYAPPHANAPYVTADKKSA